MRFEETWDNEKTPRLGEISLFRRMSAEAKRCKRVSPFFMPQVSSNLDLVIVCCAAGGVSVRRDMATLLHHDPAAIYPTPSFTNKSLLPAIAGSARGRHVRRPDVGA